MIELQRSVQLPPPSGAPSPPAESALAGMALRPIEPSPGLRGLPVWHGGRRPIAEDEAAETTVGSPTRGVRIYPESLSDDAAAARGQLRLGRLAFLAQQIYQEAMPSGLHLEPWARGISAYRQAGAEPLAESAAPAAVSFSV